MNHFAVLSDMGGGTRHIELARELVRRGWRVSLAASDFHLHRRSYMRRRGADAREVVREQVDGVDVAWVWAAPYEGNDARRVRNWLSFGRSLRRLDLRAEAPDLVIGSTPHLFAALAAWRLARRADVPFILEVRDLWPESLVVGGRRRGPGWWGLYSLAKFLYRVADRVIVLARGTGDYLTARGVHPDRIWFVPNGVDASAFDEASRPARDSLRLAYAGAHGPANGLEAVLDAAELLRADARVSFVLVGDGPSRPALREAASRRQLSNMCFHDPVPKSAIPGLLAECDAGLMVLKDVPLFSFGVSPNKLFDYWGASLPVVCNVPGEVASLVAESGGGVQARDATGAALATAIRSLLDRTPEERLRMGANGRTWVERERDRPLIAERLDRHLRTLLGETP